jgi:hypothetical protein
MKIKAWGIALCNLVQVDFHFIGTFCLHNEVDSSGQSVALIKTVERTSETSVYLIETALRYNPEVYHLYSRGRENLKSPMLL